MKGIKQEEAERKKKAYALAKLLIRTKPPKKTLKECFEEVSEELGYLNYRNVSNIYHQLKKSDPKRLDNFKDNKKTKII